MLQLGWLENLRRAFSLSLSLPFAASAFYFAQNRLCCPKTAQQPAWPCASDPTDVHSLSRWLGLAGGEFEGGELGSSGLARCHTRSQNFTYLPRLGHLPQPHPL